MNDEEIGIIATIFRKVQESEDDTRVVITQFRMLIDAYLKTIILLQISEIILLATLILRV